MQIGRRPTWEKLEGVYKPESTNILKTQKLTEKVQTHALLNNAKQPLY